MELAALFRNPERRGWIAWEVVVEAAVTGELEVNGDVREWIVTRKGKVLHEQKTPRRWHSEGVVIPVALEPGRNVIIVEVVAASGDARFGLAYHVDAPLGALPERAPSALALSRARLVKAKDGSRYVEVKTKQAINWTHDGERGIFQVKDGRGAVLRQELLVSVVGPDELRLGPIAGSFETPLEITGARLRRPDGQPFEPLEAPVPVAGAR